MSPKSKSSKPKAGVSRSSAITSSAPAPKSALRVRGPSRHGAYGWLRDLPDARDMLFAAPFQTLPPAVDLRPSCPPVYDQGQLGSCTGNGIAAAIEFDQMKQKSVTFAPSRLFIYYNERVIEGTVSQDSGAQIRDGIKAVAKLGAPPESVWPYDVTKFAQKPPAAAFADAKTDLVTVYSKVAQNLQQMQGCLAAGYPFIIGITAYESFESQPVASSGVVPMPAANEQTVGGHCMLVVGYDSTKRVFIVRNSWGSGWGMKGYCTFPFEYLTSPSYSSDFWTIRSVAG